MLEPWKIYIHRNIWDARYIIDIDDEWYVYYTTQSWTGWVSKKENFARSCPYEATEEEVSMLLD